jgi:hypothetical protein
MHRRNVGFWAEMWSRRGESFNVQDFDSAVKMTVGMLSVAEDVLVHCKQGKHRSGAFLCFILALVSSEDLATVLNQYLEMDLYPPRDRKFLQEVVFECDLHTRLQLARADPDVKRHLDTISQKLEERRGVGESAIVVSDDESSEDKADATERRGVEESAPDVSQLVGLPGPKATRHSTTRRNGAGAQTEGHLAAGTEVAFKAA